MKSFFVSHKKTVAALVAAFLYSATLAFAIPPGSPYTAGQTLDPACAPGDTNCSVTISAGGTPAGADTQIQFNNAGAFGASANLIWNNTTNRLGIGDATPLAALTVGANDAFQVADTGAVTIGRGTVDPTGTEGTLFYRTDTDTLRLYDTAWTDLTTTSYLTSNYASSTDLVTDGAAAVAWNNILNAPVIGTNSDTQLIHGGQVSYVSGYTFNVSQASYKILGTTYSSTETQLTLAAADPTNDRIDVIAVNTSGQAVVITGTPSGSPEKPYVNPDTQLELTFITVGANTVAPSITELDVYAENTGTPTEWNRSSNNGAIVLNSPTLPRNGTVSINATSVPQNARLTFSPAAPFDINTTTQLVLYIRSKATWGNNRRLSLAFANATGQKGSTVSINRTGSFGFDSASTAAYQQVVIPISNFAIPQGTLITEMTITTLGTSGTMGFYIDDISLESGTPITSSNSFTIATANSSSITITGNGLVSNPLTAALNGTYIDANYFKQGGNSFAAAAILGTNDANALVFETNDLERMRITTSGRILLSNTANSNIFFGQFAGNETTTGGTNLGIGHSALFSNTSGWQNTALGGYAVLYGNTTGYMNTAVGNTALRENTTGYMNTSIGNDTLRYNTTGIRNTAVGTFALNANGTGSYNTALGAYTLFGQGFPSGTPSYNTAVGYQAMYRTGSGTYNTGVGGNALFYVDAGATSNTGVGYGVLQYNTTGNNNVGLGFQAGYGATNVTNISNGVFLGYRSGFGIRTGADNNIFIGYEAGYNVSTGAKNIIIGHDIDAPSATDSNQLSIGNIIFGTGVTGTGTTIAGNIGIGLNNPAYRFDVLQNTTAQTASNRVANFSNTSATFDTTAGTLSSYGGYFASTSTRSAGANDLTNVGLYATASGAQQNYAAIFDQGNVGIGTTTPTTKLAISDIVSATGSELITNGTFTGDASGWTLGNCAVYGSNQVTVTYTACTQPRLSTTVATTAGSTYFITFTISGATGKVQPYFSNNWQLNDYGPFLNGTYTVALKATYTGTDTLNFGLWSYQETNSTWTIDNVSFKEAPVVKPLVAGVGFTGKNAISLGGFDNNVALGVGALTSNTTGTDNIAIGSSSLFSTTTGDRNVAVGGSSLLLNTSGRKNISIGYYSLLQNIGGSSNIAIGDNALSSNNSNSNTAIGASSLQQNTTGYENTAVGESSLNSSTTGNRNTGLGRMALVLNTTGSLSTGVGYGGLYSNTTGVENTGVGQMSLYGNRTGNYNTVVGSEAGYGAFNNNMSNNTFIGYRAAYGIRSNGNNNVIIGFQAGDNLTTGSKNIVIGHDIDVPLATTSNQLNIGNIIFGTGVTGTGTTIAGSIGIGTNAPTAGAVFDINGNTILSGTNRYLNFGTTSGTSGYGFRDNAGIMEVKNNGGAWASLGGWGLTGNTGTNPTTNFIGTTDAQDLVLRTNNTEKVRILSNGNVGIGTATPTASLGIGFVNGFSSYQLFVAFAGGLDDGVFSGTYTGGVANKITVSIDSTGTPDTFSWSDDNAECAGGSNVPITGGLQLLCNGIGITFGATTGHTNSTAWVYVYENEQAIVQAQKNNINYINIKTNRISIGKNAGENTGAPRSVFIGEEAGRGAFGIDYAVFLGYNSGVNALVATSATFLGNTAGYGATSAEYSSFVGSGAGSGATGAYYSQFMGASAGAAAIDASSAVFIGHTTGENATNSAGSVFIGAGAGSSATGVIDGNFIGVQAGGAAANASYSNLFGYRTGFGATNVSYSTIMGYRSGSSFTSNNIGSNNIIIGTNISLPNATANAINIGGVLFGTGTYSTTTGDPSITPVSGGKIGIGVVSPGYRFDVLDNNTAQTASNRVANFSNTGATFNTGAGALTSYGGYFSSTSTRSLGGNNLTNVGLYTTASGAQVNYAAHIDGILRLSNINIQNIGTRSISIGAGTPSVTDSFFFGEEAGAFSTNTSYSFFAGYRSGYNATNAQRSNFIGNAAGQDATNASYSNFLGNGAGSLATGATHSNFFGFSAGINASAASYSNFLGQSAGDNATNASYSNFLGVSSGSLATNASYSNFLGNGAGQQASAASYSNLFGYRSGAAFSGNNVGSNNIIIGTNISLPNATANAINIGGVLFGTGTYSTTTGNPSITPVSGGKIGIGVAAPTYTLQVGNSSIAGIVARFENSTGTCDINPTTTALVCSSDINLKKNITIIGSDTVFMLNTELAATSYSSMLKKLTALTPVVYNWNGETDTDTKHAGFIAQEVEQLFPDLVTVDPVTGYRSLGYTGLIPYTISALEELDIAVTDITSLTETTPLRVSLVAWFGDVANGINQFFAKEVKTEKLCITDASGEVCITKDQLYQVLQGNTSGQGGGTTTQQDTTTTNSSDDQNGDVSLDTISDMTDPDQAVVITPSEDEATSTDQPADAQDEVSTQ